MMHRATVQRWSTTFVMSPSSPVRFGAPSRPFHNGMRIAIRRIACYRKSRKGRNHHQQPGSASERRHGDNGRTRSRRGDSPTSNKLGISTPSTSTVSSSMPKSNQHQQQPSSSSVSALRSFGALLWRYVAPVRYRYSASAPSPFSSSSRALVAVPYTIDHATAVGWRFPLWLGMVWLVLLPNHSFSGSSMEQQEQENDQSSSFPLIGFMSVIGPSMIPTISPDGSDIFLAIGELPAVIRRMFGFGRSGSDGFWMGCGAGDLVGIQFPRYGNRDGQPPVISCKRIVGVEGDAVKRYGQYVHLFLSQDPDGLGIIWPTEDDRRAQGLDPSCPWDPEFELEQEQHGGGGRKKKRDPHRTVMVPSGHVWVEGDCPGLSVDSRHYGPVPLEAIRGKVVAKMWPLRPTPNWKRRPHPIPIDNTTLMQHNVHRVVPNLSASR